MMTFSTTSFANGETIPTRHTCDGDNLSPGFAWSRLPAGTQSLLLVCEDPDAPRGTFHHWAAFDIPPGWDGLHEGCGPDAPGLRQAVNDFGKPGYGGACPPHGDGPHGYRFRLYALDTGLTGVPGDAGCAEVMRKAEPHVLEFAEVVGYYGR